ncbi:MAG: crotonase [Candidatus Cloacimonetes bacterium 4572_55]|nr:MAG: crotonase [Candidatus Cloacimonetes bacterium 4572_55]
MKFNELLIEYKKDIAIVAINRGKALNALNTDTLRQLSSVFCELENREEIRVIILTGSGTKAFVAGADIQELSDLDHQSGLTFSQLGHQLMDKIERQTQPVIAAINGFALGGGCEIALACDIRVAIETAKLGLPEVSLGLIPGFGGTQRLARAVGRGKAKQLIFTGDMINAVEAYRIGLVDEVVPAQWAEIKGKKRPDGEVNKANLLAYAEKLAEKIAARGQIAVQAAKRGINHGMNMSLSDANAFERSLFAGLFATADAKEGLGAFLEKRSPEFQSK